MIYRCFLFRLRWLTWSRDYNTREKVICLQTLMSFCFASYVELQFGGWFTLCAWKSAPLENRKFSEEAAREFQRMAHLKIREANMDDRFHHRTCWPSISVSIRWAFWNNKNPVIFSNRDWQGWLRNLTDFHLDFRSNPVTSYSLQTGSFLGWLCGWRVFLVSVPYRIGGFIFIDMYINVYIYILYTYLYMHTLKIVLVLWVIFSCPTEHLSRRASG